MRTTLDFAPLYRSSVGFDRMFSLLENASRAQTVDSWPPYDIVKNGDDDYQIVMALAGYSKDELNMTQESNLLVLNGLKADDDTGQYLHRGITWQTFERRFELADHVKIASASLHNGLLTIDLKHEIPEAMKPRRIEIGSDDRSPTGKQRRIDDGHLTA